MKRFTLLLSLLLFSFALSSQVVSLILRGDSLKNEGDYEKAVELYQEGRDMIQKKGLRDSNSYVVRIMNSSAFCYRMQGEYRKALSCFEYLDHLHILDVRGKLNLSNIYLLLGFYQKTIDLLESFSDTIGESTRILNLASAYAYLGKPEKALGLMRSFDNGLLDNNQKTTFCSNKGFMELSLGEFEPSCRSLITALSLLGECPDRYVVMANLALAESEMGEGTKALLHIDSCLVWQEKHLGINHPDYAISIRKKAEILLKKGDKHQAVILFQEYFRLEKEYVRKNFAFMTEKQRQDFWQSRKDLVGECFMTEDENPDFLYNVALFSKSILLQVNKDLRQSANKNPATAFLFAEIKDLRKRLLQQKLSGEEYAEIEKTADEKELELMTQLKDYREFVSYFHCSVRDVKRALRRKTDVAIEYIRYLQHGEYRYAALLAGKDKTTEFIPLFTEPELENFKLKSGVCLKQALLSNKAADKNAIYGDSLLSSMLFKPLLKHLDAGATIYFAADGLLHLLAMEHLNFERQGYTFHRMTSTRGVFSPRIPVKKSALLLGGFDYDNYSFTGETNLWADRSASNILSALRLPPVSNGYYSYLPNSLVEVDSIFRILEKGLYNGKIKRYIGKEGTEDVFKKKCSHFGIIHLATHGFCILSSRSPSLAYRKDSISEDVSLLHSGILFAGANKLSAVPVQGMEDGILLAGEVCDLDFSGLDLVVLSACQTGLGEITSDGIFGLQRGFKKAGAGTLLMSLWNVNDEATAILMSEFYRNLLNDDNKYSALHKAQSYVKNYEKPIEVETDEEDTSKPQIRRLGRWVYPFKKEVKKIRPFQAPVYWAGFILLDGM